MKSISLLGSTGSIGKNVLEVVRSHPGRFRVVGMSVGSNIELLRQQMEAFAPLMVSVADPEAAEKLKNSLPPDMATTVIGGSDAAKKIAAIPEAEVTVSAMVGGAGLLPTMAAIEAGKDIALANKETLVMAGDLVIRRAEEKGVKILPVDSEHSAIFQCLTAGRENEVKKIILTASGGPFINRSPQSLWDVSREEALAHPNWDMGAKISIDSATMMNKGLEIIEAFHLFGVALEDIEVLVHPQSIVHSMVEFRDGSIISHMGVPDMRIPIAHALAWPERIDLGMERLNLVRAGDLSFFRPDFKKFPALKLAYQAAKIGGTMPAVMNGANEVAVAAFLDEKIRFPEIPLVVAETMDRSVKAEAGSIRAVVAADLAARMQAEAVVEAFSLNLEQKREKKVT